MVARSAAPRPRDTPAPSRPSWPVPCSPLTGALGIGLLVVALAALATTGALGAACLGARTAAELLLTALRHRVGAGRRRRAAALPVRARHARGARPRARCAHRGRRARLARPRPAATAVASPSGRALLAELHDPARRDASPSSSACAALRPRPRLPDAGARVGLARLPPRASGVLGAATGRSPTCRTRATRAWTRNPPGAEIGVLATMLLSGGDRFAALPQVTRSGGAPRRDRGDRTTPRGDASAGAAVGARVRGPAARRDPGPDLLQRPRRRAASSSSAGSRSSAGPGSTSSSSRCRSAWR